MRIECTTLACNLPKGEKDRKGGKNGRLFSLVNTYFNGIKLSKAAPHPLYLWTVVLVQTIGQNLAFSSVLQSLFSKACYKVMHLLVVLPRNQ